MHLRTGNLTVGSCWKFNTFGQVLVRPAAGTPSIFQCSDNAVTRSSFPFQQETPKRARMVILILETECGTQREVTS